MYLYGRCSATPLFHADGRSYLKLATDAGVSDSTLHDIVNCKAFPRWDTLQAVLSASGVPLVSWPRVGRRTLAPVPISPVGLNSMAGPVARWRR